MKHDERVMDNPFFLRLLRQISNLTSRVVHLQKRIAKEEERTQGLEAANLAKDQLIEDLRQQIFAQRQTSSELKNIFKNYRVLNPVEKIIQLKNYHEEISKKLGKLG